MAVAPPAGAQDDPPPPEVAELRLPEAWATSTGEGVVVAVLDGPVDPDLPLPGGAPLDPIEVADPPSPSTSRGDRAVSIVALAAPDAGVVPVQVVDDDGDVSPGDLATGIARAADAGAGVIALTLGHQPDLTVSTEPEAFAALADETVQRAVRAAASAGVTVVTSEPEASLPDDLPVVPVGDGTPQADAAVSGDTAAVAGAAALLAAQGRTPEEIGELLVNTAQGPERTVDAAAAVEQAANLGAGGAQAPPPGDSEGTLSPALVGALALAAAVTAVGGTIFIATRRPRQQPGP